MQVGRPNVMTRNAFLRTVGAGIAGSAALATAGCGDSAVQHGGSGWKQYSGMTLNFISENTGPSSAIAANLQPFTELTGIKVNISQLVLTSVEQQVALDLSAHSGQYQVIYADPYNIMAPLSHGFADLTPFLHDKTLPTLPKGVGDFVPTQLLAAGRFGDNLLALPYDCPTIIWCYRKDLFEKHRAAMQTRSRFRLDAVDRNHVESVLQIAKWFNTNQNDVPYGTGHQAKQFTSLNDDFANVLWAYGGDYFHNGEHIGMYGSTDPGPSGIGRSGPGRRRLTNADVLSDRGAVDRARHRDDGDSVSCLFLERPRVRGHLQRSGRRDASRGASQLITQTGVNWGQLTAIGTVVALPMVIIGLAVRKYLVRGLTLGAVTGE